MPTITIHDNKSFYCADSQTILDAARASGIGLEYSCRSGRCGVCKSLVLEGSSENIKPELSLSDSDQSRGYILTCCRTASSDLRLDADDLGRIGQIECKTLPCKIDKIGLVTDSIIEVVLRLPPTSALNYVPGQYIDVMGENGIRRSYSIANAPREDNKIVLQIRKVHDGVMSRYWFEEAKDNDLLRIEGPLGTFSLRDSSKPNLLLLATGTGIAPIKAMLEELDRAQEKRFNRIDLYWGVRYPDEIYWIPRFDSLPIQLIRVISSMNKDEVMEKLYIQNAVIRNQLDLKNTTVYACGSELMIRDARKLLTENGLDSRHFYSDAFVSSS